MKTALLLAAAAGSGAAATLSLPAWCVHWLAWVALVPLLYALRQASLPLAAALGLVFGAVLGAASFSWVSAMPDVNAQRFGLMIVVFSAYYAAFGALYAAASRRLGPWLIVAAPALWVGCEYARGNLSFLAYPWNFLAHSQHESLALIQIADMTGAYGVSFVLVMVNQLASELIDPALVRRWRGPVIGTAMVLAATLAYGWHALSVEPPHDGKLRVAIVQANLTARNGMSVRDQMRHLAAYERLTRLAAAERPELIVWPSSSLPGPISFWMIRVMVGDIASRADAPLLVGGAGGDKFAPARDGERPYSNSEFLVSAKGTLEAQYNKVRLTPFNEEVPLQGTVVWPRWISQAEKSFVRGDSYTVFEVGAARFGAPICWENAFPQVFRRFVADGANFMVSVTNESIFGASSGPYQTLAMNAFRAVENRVAVVRAATTGVSGFIDAHGRLLERVADAAGRDLNVAGFLVRDVPLARGTSFYTRHGDVFAIGVALLALLALGAAARRPLA
jgi:apolipoprotein N-acyltransferase